MIIVYFKPVTDRRYTICKLFSVSFNPAYWLASECEWMVPKFNDWEC